MGMNKINSEEEKYKSFLDKLKDKYGKTVTEISKSSSKDYIKNDTVMISGDDLKNPFMNIEMQSVDAIHYYIENGNLIILFFEFKNLNLFDKNFYATDKLNNTLQSMKEFEELDFFVDEIKSYKRNLSDKKLMSLKSKPLETLIILQNLYQESKTTVVNIEKHYYLVSQTPLGDLFKNKSNYSIGKRTNQIFGFKYKLEPYPFKKVQPINKNEFLDLIS